MHLSLYFNFSSQEILCTGSNVSAMPHTSFVSTIQTQPEVPSSFTPSLAAHFDENLTRHIQGWPSENTEKQVRVPERWSLQFQSRERVVGVLFSSCTWVYLTRRLGCGRTSTTWAACTCLKSAQKWKTFALWFECVKFRLRWGSRGKEEKQTKSWRRHSYFSLTFCFPSTESCSWGSRAKSSTNLRIRTPTWREGPQKKRLGFSY